GDALHTGRFASAVGSDDSKNLSFTYGKGDVVDNKQVSVPLDEVLNRHNFRCVPSAESPSSPECSLSAASGRPRRRKGAAFLGSLPASVRACRNSSSICALRLRNSSDAHRLSASCTTGSRRSRIGLRSLLMDRGFPH